MKRVTYFWSGRLIGNTIGNDSFEFGESYFSVYQPLGFLIIIPKLPPPN